jgi:GH15 family glucan-1,4-alpha-glucosidase
MDIYSHSIEVIRSNQASSGAYLASPNFPTYRYCWLRDGSFIAYAMDLVGQQESASRFHDWVATCINRRTEIIHRAIKKYRNAEPLCVGDYLHARYHLDGSEAIDQDWPNFQLDGYGTWLWALNEHVQQTSALLPAHQAIASDLAADYLTTLWKNPCYDCWEENPESVHPYTLAAIMGGLAAHKKMIGQDHTATLAAIRQYVLANYASEGYFTKFAGATVVDANLLGISVPYNLVEADHPAMRATVVHVEKDLCKGGGVHRYAADTYYGGGEWLLLTAWLGWYYTRVGEFNRARALLNWVERQADDLGNMPEQVATHLLSSPHLSQWEGRWGKVASPLLWSHAMYLILYLMCEK